MNKLKKIIMLWKIVFTMAWRMSREILSLNQPFTWRIKAHVFKGQFADRIAQKYDAEIEEVSNRYI